MRSARISLIALSFFLSAGITSAGLFSRKKPTELAVRTTAYTHSESDHIKYGRKTAAGGTLKYGKKYSSAAADWSKFPLGTKFKIDGMNTTFVVDDYGRALVGTETIDIYKPSRSAMNQWGVKHVDIKILEYGDYEKSREILEQRTKYAHVRQMLAGIKKNPGPKPQKKSSSVTRTKSSNSAPKSSASKPIASAQSTPKPAPKPASAPASAKQLASAQPNPKPAGASAPAKPTTAPAIPAPPIPEPESTPSLATAITPENSPEPGVQPENPQPAPAPHPPLPAPALRKVKRLDFASLTPSTPIADPVASEIRAEEKPAVPPNKLRKRAFRPLSPSANG